MTLNKCEKRPCQQLAQVVCLLLRGAKAVAAVTTEAIVRFNRNDVSHDWAQIHVLLPSYGDNREIRILVSKFYDAQGCFLKVNQIMSD